MKDEEIVAGIENGLDDCALEIHFLENKELNVWIDVADEGRRVMDLIAGTQIAAGSPLDDLFCAISFAAHLLAFRVMGAALGVDPEALRLATCNWEKDGDWVEIPPPVKAEAVIRKAREFERYLVAERAYKAGISDVDPGEAPLAAYCQDDQLVPK